MIKPTQQQGTTQEIIISNYIETIPFSFLSSEKTQSQFGIDDFTLARIRTVTYTNTNNNKNTQEEEKTTNWKLHTQKDIDNYIKTGILKTSFDNNDVYLFISESNLNKIKEKGYFESNHQYKNILDLDDFTINEKFLLKGTEKFHIVKFHKLQLSNAIETNDGQLFSSTIHLDSFQFSSEFWNLDDLLTKIINNPQFKFFTNNEYQLQIVDVNNPNDVSKIIAQASHHSQNDEGNLENFSAIYFPNKKEIEQMIKHKNDSYGDYSWTHSFINNTDKQLTKEEILKLHIYDKQNIVALCADGIESLKTYQAAVEKKINNPVKKSKSPFRN